MAQPWTPARWVAVSHPTSAVPFLRTSLVAALAVVVVLAVVSMMVTWAGGVQIPVRTTGLLVVAGLALLPWPAVADWWARPRAAAGVGALVAVLLALAMVAFGLWHPLVAAGLLLLVGAHLLVFAQLRPDREQVAAPARRTGSLVDRFIAHLIDLAAPVALVGAVGWFFVTPYADATPFAHGAAVAGVLAGWFGLSWALLVRTGASPGLAVMGLRVVGAEDSRPVGAARALARTLSLAAVECTPGTLVVMVIDLSRRRDRRSWSDRLTGSSVVPVAELDQHGSPEPGRR